MIDLSNFFRFINYIKYHDCFSFISKRFTFLVFNIKKRKKVFVWNAVIFKVCNLLLSFISIFQYLLLSFNY